MQVTARELKLRLGRYLAVVQRGEPVRITLRGRPIADLRPVEPMADTPLTRLIAQGRATPGRGPLPPYRAGTAQRAASQLVLADRADEGA